MSTQRIPVAGPWVTEREVRYVADAAANDWYGRAGEWLKRFERAFADSVGVKYALGVPHCTAALHLAMLGFGIGPGDEVIVPESTWVATATPIFHCGATAVFADIDPLNWCITAEAIERCLTPRTKAIITVDLYGGIPDMPAIEALARRKGIPILEDAAQSIGADLNGRKAGAFGDMATFSFHGTKTVTTGEGGMLVTDSKQHFDRCAFLRDHCRTPESFRHFVTLEIGHKYKMSGLQAAFGLAQLERLDELIARKRTIFGWYKERLAGIPGLTLNQEPPGLKNTFWMVTMVLDRKYGLDNRQMMAYFDGLQIDTRPFFPPLSSLPAFANVPDAGPARARNVVAYDLGPRALNLPSALLLEEAQVDRVCTAVRELLKR
ncbi:MAG TPA: DegT/DnrJ/EryC1/StrS family aminotransferase [Polyangia bacterium]|nr:DegT/DnrJ/EryC1/StrS family aminotransferase [Polyangia bacterium]